jgi:hypothetical protein
MATFTGVFIDAPSIAFANGQERLLNRGKKLIVLLVPFREESPRQIALQIAGA